MFGGGGVCGGGGGNISQQTVQEYQQAVQENPSVGENITLQQFAIGKVNFTLFTLFPGMGLENQGGEDGRPTDQWIWMRAYSESTHQVLNQPQYLFVGQMQQGAEEENIWTFIEGARGLGGMTIPVLALGIFRNFESPASLTQHFNRHKSEFGFTSETDEYLTAANNFINTQGNAGVLSKVRANGDNVIFNPTTNEFLVLSSKGIIRTYFMPNPLIHGYPTNLEYFNNQ
jgi:hypothetical protein